MKFLALELKGIRHFSELMMEFTEGLNIVYGPNESGKSTVLESLLASLLKPTQKEISSLKKWGSTYSEITLTYTTGEDTFTITRILSPEVRDILKGAVTTEEPLEVEKALEKHSGFTDRLLFESSTVVKQNEMQILQEEGSRARIRDRVRSLISGVPQRSTDDALLFLEKSVYDAKSFLNRAEERAQFMENELLQYRGTDEELKDVETRLTVYKSDLARDQTLHEGYGVLLQYRKAENEYRDLVELLEELENLETYIRKIPIREKELIDELHKELEKISAHQDRLIAEKRKTREELTEQKDKLSGLDDELEGERVEKESFVGKLATLFKGSSRAKREMLTARRVEVSQNVARLEDLSEQIEEQLTEWRRKFQLKGEQLRSLMEQCGEYENWTSDMLEDRRNEYESKIEGILKGMTREDLEQKISMKREEADKLRGKMVKNYPDLKDKQDTERISIERVKLAEIITEWEEKIRGLEAQLEIFSSRVKKREMLREELLRLRREMEEKTLQRKADEIALNVIKLMYQDLKEKFAPELEKRAEVILSRITHGKYVDITVRKEDLEVFVRAPEKSEPVDVDVLSQGTRDQLYLSLRIALSELLSGDKNPPLLFDEAFATFDEERLKETLHVLREIARSTQVIIFTHDESYARYGNAIPLK